MSPEKVQDTTDYINIKPDPIKFLTKEEFDLVLEYNDILTALRNNNLSTKDIHKLFFNKETKSHDLTLKTIYRHLEKLENAGLIQEAGYRITKGSRIAEKLYCRTANLFYQKFVEGIDNWWEQPDGEAWSENLRIMIGELFSGKEIEKDAFYSTFKEFAEIQYKAIISLLEMSGMNKKVANVYESIGIEKVNKLNYYVSIIFAFLQKPDLIEKFKKLCE